MAIIYIPVIDKKKYDILRDILGSQVPDTFDKWGDMLTDKAAQVRPGDTVRNVNVDPDEFVRFLGATNAKHDLDALDVFTAERSAGKVY